MPHRLYLLECSEFRIRWFAVRVSACAMIVVTAAMMQFWSLSNGSGSDRYTEEQASPLAQWNAAAKSTVPVKTESAGSNPAGGRLIFPPPDLSGLSPGSGQLAETRAEPGLSDSGQAVQGAAYTPIPFTGGVEQWRPLVASIFPAEMVDAALRVMACESGGNPNATGSAGERGLFQIHPLHRDSTYDPEGNVRAALRISGGYSWAAWTCRKVLE